jgi:uncharacterized protein (DUF1697 family)
MTRAVALIRAINVGGHTVKGARLVELFEDAGLDSVSTHANSGNVLFDLPAGRRDALERRLTAHLTDALGFPADTFVRTSAEIEGVIACDPFPGIATTPETRTQVGFMSKPPTDAARQAVRALAADLPHDHLAFEGSELYWRYEGRMTDSALGGGPQLAKTLAVPVTFRATTMLAKVDTLLRGA